MATSWHADKDAEQLKKDETEALYFFLKRLKIQTPFSFEPSLDAEPKTNSIQPCDGACHFHLQMQRHGKKQARLGLLGSASAKMEWNERCAEDGKQKIGPFLTFPTPVTSSSALPSCHASTAPEPS